MRLESLSLITVWFVVLFVLDHFLKGNLLFIVFFILISVVFCLLIFRFLFKGANSETYLQHYRFIEMAEPYIQSCKPITGYEYLVTQIKSELVADGLAIVDNIELFPGVCPSIAYRKIHQLGASAFNYFFLINNDTAILNDENIEKVKRIIEKIRLSDSSLFPTDYVIFALFVDSVDSEMAERVIEHFNFGKTKLPFMTAAYEMPTGKVYFMNGKAPLFSTITYLQKLIYKYIVGESSHAAPHSNMI